jgi:hypothetical protein
MNFYCCTHCNRKYKTQIMLKKHFVAQHGDSDMITDLQPTLVKKQDKQVIKKQIVNNNASISDTFYQCNYCNKKYRSIDQCQLHMKTKHQEDVDVTTIKQVSSDKKNTKNTKNTKNGSIGKCCICWEKNAIMMTMPCNHLAYCKQCSIMLNKTAQKCGVCRTPISSIVRVYTT